MNPQYFVLLNSVPSNDLFALNAQTMISAGLTLLNVGVLAFVLIKLLHKPVRAFLAARTERIQNELKNASDENLAAHELKAKYELLLKDIDVERNDILDNARRDASDRSKQILDEAKTEADAIRDRAMHNIELEQERVKDDMRRSIIELSGLMAQKYVSRTIDTELQDKLFTEVITELDGTEFNTAMVG